MKRTLDTERSGGRYARACTRRVRSALALLLFILLAGGAGCNSGDATLAQVDPDAVPQDPDYEIVFGIIQRECAPCHTGADDGGEEEGASTRAGPRPAALGGVEPDLTTCIGIRDSRADIDEQIRENKMPNGAWPRLSSEEKLIIERWMLNGAVAPCN